MNSAYDRRPVTVTLLLSVAALLLVWQAPFFGGAVIPYDYQAAHYPWYVDAIRAARFNPFCLYNPFNDAGVPTWNLFAFNDPIQWVPYLLPQLPGYTALESLELAHLTLIPIGLLLVAWANDVPKRRWIFVAIISLAAFAMGPTLKFMQQSVGIVASGYVVLLLGALEAFRRSGSVYFALLAGVAAAYVFEAFVYPAIFLPIVLLAYVCANGRELFQTRRRGLALGVALVAAIVVAAPALLISVKIDQSIDVVHHFAQVEFTEPLLEGLGMLGAPTVVLALVAIPSALLALSVAGLGSLTPARRWAYAAAIVALVVYGFGDLTPFGPLFRHLYPIAALVRRPYATWYVLVPFLLVLATIGLRSLNATVIRVTTAVALVATGAAAVVGASALALATVLTSQLATLWRPRLVVLAVVVVVQWMAIDWLPFTHSDWQPKPIPVAERYLNPYREVVQYFGGPQASSTGAFRIANVGVGAQFGPSAGMFQYYNVAGDANTFIPYALVRELGTSDLRVTALPGYLEANPGAFASAPWRRLAIRYYVIGSEVFAALPHLALAKPGLRVIPTTSYWKIVEDDDAAPFVAGIQRTGSQVSVAAAMTRDSFALTVPPGVDAVRFAQNYDSWWHAYDDQGIDRSNLLRDDDGQLALSTQSLAGRRVSVVYTDTATTFAVGLTIATQLGLIVTCLALWIVRIRRRSAAPSIA